MQIYCLRNFIKLVSNFKISERGGGGQKNATKKLKSFLRQNVELNGFKQLLLNNLRYLQLHQLHRYKIQVRGLPI